MKQARGHFSGLHTVSRSPTIDPDFETYLHRIGRTGRLGERGTAISLIDDTRSVEGLDAIESHFSVQGKEMIRQAEPDPERLADVIEI